MGPGELLLTEENLDGAWAVAVAGDLDLHTAPDLCRRLTARRGQRVVVDLSKLGFCDSCGLRALMGEAREAQFAGGRVSFVAPTEGSVLRLLELTGLVETLRFHADRARAVAAA
jgi:anti-sigma B factor antagonist